MTAVAVSAQATRLDDASTSTQWGDRGSGPGGAVQGDWFYNDTDSYARKGTTAIKGVYMSDNVDSDLTGSGTYEVVMFKYSTITPGLLETAATPATYIYIGSNSTVGSGGTDNNIYYREGSDDWPVDKAWLIIAIDPTITGYRSSVENSPDFSVTDYYGYEQDQTGASKDLNLAMAAVDIGAGLTLVSGDGADADGTWQDFADFDFGTDTNRYGFVQSVEAPFIVTGKLIIGTATDTVFTDTGAVVIFADSFTAAGWAGIEVSCDTGNVYTETNSTFIGKGNTTTTDTRPTLTFTGAGGSAVLSGCNYTNWATLALVEDVDWTDGTWVDSDQITMTGSPTVDGLAVLNPTNDGAMYIDDVDALDNMQNITFDGAGVGGTTADAAIEIDISGAGPHTIDLTNFVFQNRVGSSVDLYFVDQGADRTYTVNILGGGTLATFTKQRGTDTVTVVSAVDYTLTGIANDTEVTILDNDVSALDITGSATAQAFGQTTGTDEVGQSFQIASTMKVERVRLNIRKVGTPTDGFTVKLVNGVPGSSELASSLAIPAADITTSFVEYDIYFTSKQSLTASTTYGLEFARTGATSDTDYYEIEYDTGNPHTSGSRYTGP